MLTNEEKRISQYSASSRPTIPSEVNPNTPLSSLNLNWREKDLPERERTKHVHRLHPYLGKYIPQLVEIFLRKYFKSGQTVLDPFCGSGTTLIQANELGINSVGFDISAFNVLLCQAKTQKYDIEKAETEIKDALEKVRSSKKEQFFQLSLFNKYADIEDTEYLAKWFAPQTLEELLKYLQLIQTQGYEYQNLLKIILSRSARSSRLTTHFDLDFPKNPQIEPYYCFKHSRTCSPTQEAYKFLSRYSLDTIKRIKEYSKLRTSANIEVIHGDSRELEIPPADGIITSPPYVGLIDYHDQHAYAYHLLGLRDRRGEEIGAAANGSSQKAKEQYQQDIADVFHRAANSMQSGGRVIVVAADRSNLYDKIANLAGLEIEDKLDRHVNRRTGRRSTEFFETIFIWRKPFSRETPTR
jgi:DNA modification methylase